MDASLEAAGPPMVGEHTNAAILFSKFHAEIRICQGEDFGDEIEMTISKMMIRMVKVVIIKIDMMVMVMVSLQACTMYNVQYIMYNVQFTSLYSVHKMRYVTQDYIVTWCFCHLCNSRLLTIQNNPRLLEFEFATRMSHRPPF